MEKSISLSPWELSRATPERLAGRDCVYLGSEFCENKLPSAADLRKLRAMYPGKIVLATPILSNRGLKAAQALLRGLSAGKRRFEVVVNDWGLLRLIRKDFPLAVPLIGRLLTWEIAEMDKKFLNAFCKEYGIPAVETDSEEALARLKGFRGAVHFHYPLRFVSVTRFCPVTRAFNSAPCARGCKGDTVKLTNPKALPEPLHMRGNAYFIPNRPLQHRSIKRLVELYLD